MPAQGRLQSAALDQKAAPDQPARPEPADFACSSGSQAFHATHCSPHRDTASRPDAPRRPRRRALNSRRGRTGGWPLFAAFVAAAAVLYQVKVAIIPFVLALIVGFITDPLIRTIQGRTGWKRTPVAWLVFVLLLTAFLAALYGTGLSVSKDLGQLLVDAPGVLRTAIRRLAGPHPFSLFGRTVTADSLSGEMVSAARKAFGLRVAYHATSTLVLALAAVFLTWVLIAYVMIGAPQLAEGALWLVPPERRPPIRRLAPKVVPIVQRYFIGLAAVVAVTFLLAWAGFGLVLHLPHALILSIVIALLETIPGLGPFLSGVLAGLSSLSAHSLAATGLTIVYVIALRLVVDNVVAPIVLGRQTELPPFAVILSIVVGGLLFGLPGFLLAVPIGATVRIVLRAAYEDRENQAERS